MALLAFHIKVSLLLLHNTYDREIAIRLTKQVVLLKSYIVACNVNDVLLKC